MITETTLPPEQARPFTITCVLWFGAVAVTTWVACASGLLAWTIVTELVLTDDLRVLWDPDGTRSVVCSLVALIPALCVGALAYRWRRAIERHSMAETIALVVALCPPNATGGQGRI